MAIPSYVVNKRPSVTAFAFGRAWYAGVDDIKWRSRLFFSQVMISVNKVGNCHQEADPTAETINSQIASDGGYLNIPDLGNVIGLFNLSDSLIIIADNGVWSISPDTNGFSPTSFVVSRLTEIAGLSRHGVTVMEGTLLYVADAGIMQISQGQQRSTYAVSSVTDKVIDTFYRNVLTAAQKANMRLKYDQFSKKLWGFYDLEYNNTQRYIQFDARKAAWTKGQFLDDTLAGHAWLPFTTLKGNPINGLRVLLRWDDNGTISYPVAEFNDANFYDFGISTAFFSSYLEFSPVTLDNPQFNKSALYITNYFTRTEKNWVDDGNGNAVLNFPSGVDVTLAWDYSDPNNTSFNKVGKKQQGYRFRKSLSPQQIGSLFDIPQKTITTKLLARGTGHALTVRYDGQIGKDFKLLGFTVPMTMDGNY